MPLLVIGFFPKFSVFYNFVFRIRNKAFHKLSVFFFGYLEWFPFCSPSHTSIMLPKRHYFI